MAERVALDLTKDPARFDLGAGVLHTEPQTVFFVRKDGVADTLGLESGDRVLSADGKALGSVWELQKLVAVSAGKKIDIEVERKGKKKVRKVKVPDRLPEIAAGSRH
jgi:regulator of sigma E protease